MSQRQRMPMQHPGTKLEWRCLAVTADEPLAFAKELESTLQELTDNGFVILNQMQRERGLVIVAHRVSSVPGLLTTPTLPDFQPREQATRKRIVERPARAHGETTDEVLYHYTEHGVAKQLPFPGLVDALRVVKQHLESEHILPVSIVTVTMTHFEPAALPFLFKMFAEDLGNDCEGPSE